MSRYRVGNDLKNLKRSIPAEEVIGWILTGLVLIGLFLLFATMQGQAPIVDGHL
jgi:hypothetical protein